MKEGWLQPSFFGLFFYRSMLQKSALNEDSLGINLMRFFCINNHCLY